VIIFLVARATCQAIETIYHIITINHVVKSYKNCCTLMLFLDHMLCENSKEKK